MRAAAAPIPARALSDPTPRPDVQEKALWLLAIAAGAVLMVASLLPHWERSEVAPRPPEPQAQVRRVDGTIRVAVLNGCGEPQVAARMTRKARDAGLDVIHEGNASSFGFAESVVIDRSGDLQTARKVAAALGIPSAIQQISNDEYRLEQVAIVVGRDHRRLGLLEP